MHAKFKIVDRETGVVLYDNVTGVHRATQLLYGARPCTTRVYKTDERGSREITLNFNIFQLEKGLREA
jgi:hypothetical protein